MQTVMSELDLAHLLQSRATVHPGRAVVHFLKDGERTGAIFTFAQLWDRSVDIARRLLDQFGPGERIGILHDTPHEFLCSFFGCQLAGMVAVPMPAVGRKDQQRLRTRRYLQDAGAAALLVDARSECEIDGSFVCEQIRTDTIESSRDHSGRLHVGATDLSYLQYTSGSTGNPKGVCITHANVLANLRQITQRLSLTEGVSIVSWLPHHHDQGLVGSLLLAVFLGGTCHAMTPGSFVVRPLRWLEAISRHRAHLSGGPNFGYDYCTRAAKHSAVPLDLDLSTWRVAFNGAERVACSTLQQFAECFQPYGFRRAAWSPSYGLAEATLAVSMLPPGSDMVTTLERDGATHVACGPPMAGTEVAIVDAETGERRDEGEIGEIWLRGPSVSMRYWQHEALIGTLTSASVASSYLRTGDFGFLQAGQLVIVGRREDRFKIRGRNVFAADLERACRLAEAQIADCAAFMSAIDSSPHLAVELRRAAVGNADLRALAESIIQAVHRECEIAPAQIHFVRQNALPRTTSGKVRRAECARLLLSSRIETLAVHSSAPSVVGSDPTLEDPVLRNLRATLRSLDLTEVCDLDADAVIRLDSLDQLRVQHALETMFGVRAAIWGETTLRQVSEALRRPDSTELQTLQPQRPRTVLSDLQRDILVADRLCDSALFTIGCSVRIEGDVGLASLRAAFEALLQRHLILTGGVVEQGDGTWVAVTSEEAPTVEEIHSSLDGERAAIENWFSKPLPLGPRALIRVGLCRNNRVSTIAIAAHHLVADHVSMAVIATELATLCRAPLTRLPTALPYSVFADRLGETLHAQGATFQEFWRNELRGFVDPPLLNRAARQPIPDWRVHRVSRRLASDVFASIADCSKRADGTVSSVILVAFGLLIMRYSATSRVVVSCVVSLRDVPELMSTVGYMVNSVPVGLELDARNCFADLCRSARQNLDRAKSAAVYPQHLIGRELTVRSEADAISPLARYVLNVVDERHGSNSNVEARPSHPLAELQVTVRLGAARSVGLEISALAARYSEELLADFAEGLERLLIESSANAERLLRDIEILSTSQQQRLRSYNGAELPLRRQRLDELIYACEPDDEGSVAVTALGGDGVWKHLTRAMLRQRSDALAASLPAVRGAPVAVVMDRSIDQIVAIVGLLRAGGIHLPIDPQMPTARIRFVLEDSGCRCALVDPAQAERLRDCGVPLIDATDPATRSVEARSVRFMPLPGASDQEPAALIYTSGSTGRPKGVLLPHAAHAARIQAMAAELNIRAADVFVQKTSISFDVSIWEIFLPLISGARLVLAPAAASFDPKLLTRVLADAQVSIVHFVPTMLREWLANGDVSRVAHHLKKCLCSGESLRAEHRDLFARLLPGTQLINLYGPTECGIDVTWSTDLGGAGDPPIGRPTANSRINILADHQVLPPSVPGQLSIGGPQLAFGYWGRPDLTAERFVPALDGEPGERVYMSGDYAVWRADGQLTYLGRMDRQVKVRGVRIELDEVRHVLLSHPDVEQAELFVIGPADAPLLAAAVLSGKALTPAQLQEFLFSQLPASAVPTSILVLASFPVLASGKCDLAQLKSLLDQAPAEPVVDASIPSEAVAEAWRAVLGVVPRPGAGFFAAGGDSIKAVRLINELARRGIRASVADIYRFQTIEEQCRRFAIDSAGRSDIREHQPFDLIDASTRTAVESDAIEDAYPLSMLQRTVVMHSFGGSRYETYVSGIRLRGKFDAAAFKSAIGRVMRAHPFLRSSLDLTDASEPLQLVHKEAMPSLQVRDLTMHDEKDAMTQIQLWTRDELANTFVWNEAPLLRFTVHLLSDDEFIVSMTDAALDGWCVALTLVDLITGYDAFVARKAPEPLPELPRYSAFVQLERESMASRESRDFWKDRARSLLPQQIPRWNLPRGAARDHRRMQISVPDEIFETLREHASAGRYSIKHMFMSLYCVMLSMLRERETVVAMIECNGRPECEGGDRMIGVFNNIVPIAVSVGARTWAQLAADLFELEAQWQPHRRFPIAETLREQGSRSLGDALFVFTHFHVLDSLRELENIQVLDVWASDETYLPLTFHVNTSAWHGTRILLDYDEAELHREQVEAIALWLKDALSSLARNTHSICAPSPADLDEGVRRYWAAHGGSTVERVLEQSARQPFAIAMTEGERSVTYKGLQQSALVCAHRLLALGVLPGENIGVVANAGIDAAVAMLGAWLAGACCVLIDPDQPRSRIDAMLVNAGVKMAWIQDPQRHELDPRIEQLSFDVLAIAAATIDVRPPANLHPTQSAYVLHTSGSTGQPKPVAVSHAALANYIGNAQMLYGMQRGQRVWSHSSIGFDFTLTTLIAPLCAGGHVICVGRHDLATILQDATEQDIAKLTPTHLQVLKRHPYLDTARLPTRIIVGGELLYTQDAQALRQLNPAIRIFNEYGPTEACVGCSVHEYEDGGGQSIEAIGEPLENLQVHLLDENLTPITADRVTGELYLSGAGLATGYPRHADATAEKFLPCPFGPPGARMYRTGDAAQFVAGHLTCIGRVDRQVKVRGHRVELGEIEICLSGCPEVARAAVAIRDGRLVAWILPHRPLDTLRTHLIRLHLERHLPDYMRPERLYEVASVPLTAHGKIDTDALEEAGEPVLPSLLTLMEWISGMSDEDASRALQQVELRKAS